MLLREAVKRVTVLEDVVERLLLKKEDVDAVLL